MIFNNAGKQSPEHRLIFCALQPNSFDIRFFITSDMDWNLVFSLAVRHRVWHQVYAALIPVQEELPVSLFQKLANLCKKDTLRILTTAAETQRIAEQFTEHAIQHCFVKGIVLNVHIYPSLNTRPCKDIDIWVDTNTYEQAIELLLTMGYQKTLSYELKGFQKQYYMSHKHDIAFYHPEKKIQVELHFSLKEFCVDILPTSAKLQSVTLFNTPIQTLQDDYHLLFLMIHGAVHAWTRLRWLNDIVLYIQSGKCDLKRVMTLAKEFHCEHIVEQCLILVQNNFKIENASLSQIILSPGKTGIKLAKEAQQFINADFELTEQYSVFNKMFFKYRLHIIKLAPPGKKFRVLWENLCKIDSLFPYVSLPDKLAFLYYILYPLWVVKIMIVRKSV